MYDSNYVILTYVRLSLRTYVLTYVYLFVRTNLRFFTDVRLSFRTYESLLYNYLHSKDIYFKEGRKKGNVLFNDALNTVYLRLYGVKHMIKDKSDSEKGNPLLPHKLLFVKEDGATGPDGAVVMSSANGLVGTGSYLGTGCNPERDFKGPMGRCKATTPSSFSLTSNRVTTNF